jgi:hypothetical protein
VAGRKPLKRETDKKLSWPNQDTGQADPDGSTVDGDLLLMGPQRQGNGMRSTATSRLAGTSPASETKNADKNAGAETKVRATSMP